MKLTLHHINIADRDVPGLDEFYGEVLMQEGIGQRETLPTLEAGNYPGRVMFRNVRIRTQ